MSYNKILYIYQVSSVSRGVELELSYQFPPQKTCQETTATQRNQTWWCKEKVVRDNKDEARTWQVWVASGKDSGNNDP